MKSHKMETFDDQIIQIFLKIKKCGNFKYHNSKMNYIYLNYSLLSRQLWQLSPKFYCLHDNVTTSLSISKSDDPCLLLEVVTVYCWCCQAAAAAGLFQLSARNNARLNCIVGLNLVVKLIQKNWFSYWCIMNIICVIVWIMNYG